VQGKLSDLFGGSAAANAETFQGRIARLKVAFDEAKETIGYALLPIIERLVSFIVNQVVPNFEKFASAFDPIKKAIIDNKESFQTLFNFIGDYVIPILTTLAGGALKVVGEVFGRIIGIIGNAIDKIEAFIVKVRDMVNKVIELYNKIPLAPNLSTIGGGVAGGAPGAISGGGSSGSGLLGSFGGAGSGTGFAGGGGGAGGSGGTNANQRALENLMNDAATLQDLVDQLSGTGNYSADAVARRNALQNFRTNESTYNITVNGAIDSESTARQIVEILNDSAARGTLGAGAFDR
jgi:hypothetical protein